MPTQDKINVVTELKEQIENHQVAVLTQFIGIDADQATKLRSNLRDQDVEFKVYKNTLAKRALDDLGFSEAVAFMEGPTAWAFSNDPVAAPKVLKDFRKESDSIVMSGGILDGAIISKDQLDALASLPTRDVLLAQLVGTIAAPLRNMVGVLIAVPRNLVNVLDLIKKQKEEATA